MKKLNTLRKRGYDLFQISLGVIVVLGALAGVMYTYFQVTNSTTVADNTRTAIAISSEIHSQYRLDPDFSAVTADADNSGSMVGSQFQVASGMPDRMFDDVTATGNGQTFTITMSNLNRSVCERMKLEDFGPRSVAGQDGSGTASDCSTGVLDITFTR